MKRQSGWFGYDGVTGRPRVRRRWAGGFRSAELNLLGWTAVLMPGLAIGLTAGWLSGRAILLFAFGGVALSWMFALGLDHVSWRRISFGLSDSRLTADEARSVVTSLRATGVEADLEVDTKPGTGAPEWRIRSTNRYRAAVRRAIEVGTDR